MRMILPTPASLWSFGLPFLLVIAACSSAPEYKPMPMQKPVWTEKAVEFQSSTEFREAMVYTVGKAEGVPTLQAARSNADGKARKRMSVLFREFVETALAGYTESGAPAETAAKARQSLEDIGMGGAPIEDRFGQLNDGIWYSLAALPYSRFISVISLNKRVPEAFTAWLEKESASIFASLQARWHDNPDNVPSAKEDPVAPKPPTMPGNTDAPLDLKLKMNEFQNE